MLSSYLYDTVWFLKSKLKKDLRNLCSCLLKYITLVLENKANQQLCSRRYYLILAIYKSALTILVLTIKIAFNGF